MKKRNLKFKKNKQEENKKEEHQMKEDIKYNILNSNRFMRLRINFFENKDRPKKYKSAIINSQVYEQNELPQKPNELNRSRGPPAISNSHNPFIILLQIVIG